MPGRVARLALTTATLGSALVLSALPAAMPYAAATPAAGDAGLGAVTPAASAAATPAGPLVLTLDAVTPVVVTDGSKVTVRATVRNTGTTALAALSATVRQDASPLSDRTAVTAWATSTSQATGTVLGRTTLRTPLAPGQQAHLTLTLTDVGAGRAATYGAVPVTIEAVSGTVRGQVHTFLGYQRVKQYVPLRLAVAVPLVLDADARLSGTGAARQSAWLAAVGTGSRLDRVAAATDGLPVGWLLDPALTRTPDVPTTPTPATTTTGGSTVTTPAPPDLYAATTAEAAARTDLADRIRGSANSHDPLLLPVGDPDIASTGVDDRVLAGARGDVAETAVDSGGLGSAAALAWPAAGQWSAAVEKATRAAYGTSLKGALVDSAWLAGRSDLTATSERRTPSGLPLVVYDHGLSDLLARSGSPVQTALATQQFVADTATLVTERSGTERSAAVVAPRDLDPDPASMRRLLTSLAGIPWLQPDTLSAQLGRASTAEGDRASLAARPPPTPPAVLSAAGAEDLYTDLRTIRAMSGVRSDPEAFAPPWRQAGAALLATSWRTHRADWAVLRNGLKAAATSASAGLYVAPRQINFLADSGRVQITVVNDLDVAVHDVSLTLVPENPRLRIDDPGVVLRIGARSRSTVTFRATALAAGSVPVTTTLTAADGTVIRTGAPVRISVTPTGDWMYWALGGIAGTILGVGIWRGLRRGKPPVPAAPLADRVPT